MSDQTKAEQVAQLLDLRAPFPPEAINQLPKGNTTLDYVSHAFATGRLLEVDPFWTWEPVAFDAEGLPQLVYDAKGCPVGLWIRLTVCGVTRLGYGSCATGKADAVKELIGDSLRNAAMRFGVALDLWKKEVPPPPQHQSQGQQRSQNGYNGPQESGGGAPNNGTPGNFASEAQIKLIFGTAKRIHGEFSEQWLAERCDKPVPKLTKSEASQLITELKEAENALQ